MALPHFRLIRISRPWLGLLAALLVSVSALGLSVSPVLAVEADDEAAFVDRINELRESQGLGPLAIDQELVSAAQSWAVQIRSNGALSHAEDLSIGVTSQWAKLGENVGVANSDQFNELFDAFVNSPGHYANLVDPSFTHIGVGVVYDDQGRMWTAHRFMAKVEVTTTTVAPTSTTEAPSTTVSSTTSSPLPTTAPTTAVSTSQQSTTTTQPETTTTTVASSTTGVVPTPSGRVPLEVVPTQPIDKKILADLFAQLSG